MSKEVKALEKASKLVEEANKTLLAAGFDDWMEHLHHIRAEIDEAKGYLC